jgi:hypothetical protein
MTALAIPPDVETALGRSLTAEETPRAVALLLLASAAVEEHTGYRFAPGTYTVGRKPRGGKVRIPADVATATVTEVNQSTGAASVITGYTLRGSTLYGLKACWVEVVFIVTAEVPDEIATLVAGIVAATLAGPPVGAESAQAGPFQMSFVTSSGKVYLSASDKLILRRYKQPRPPVALA